MTAERDDAVDVWHIALDAPPGGLDALLDTLDEDERARAGAMARPRDRERFVVAHGAMRQILSRYAGVAPAQLAFERGEHGKPQLRDGPDFNLSHSGDLAVLAVASRPVGVDVERVQARRDVAGVASRFFSAAERDRVLAAHGERRLECFFRLWSCKESCLKASGRGIGGLESLHLTWGPAGAVSGGGWAVAEFAPRPGYVAALAAEVTPRIVHRCSRHNACIEEPHLVV